MPCFYESLLTGLQQQGHHLIYYSHAQWARDFDAPLPKEFQACLQEMQPDLVILFNNAFYDISRLVSCPIVVYEVDSLRYLSNKQAIRDNPQRYHFVVPQSGSAQLLQEHLGVPRNLICYAPFFTAVRAQADVSQDTPISFIGTRFYCSNLVQRFMKSRPSSAEVDEFKAALQYVRRHPFASEQDMCDALGIRSLRVQDYARVWDLAELYSASARIQTLSVLADLGLALYGPDDWIKEHCDNPELLLSYRHDKVYSLKHNQTVYNRSKLCVNINHVQAHTGFSWRVCDVMASNACLVSEYKPDFASLFPELPIPVFSNPYEARVLCQQLLQDEARRQDIVAQCQAVVDARYRFHHLLARLDGFLPISLQGPPETVGKLVALEQLLPKDSACLALTPRAPLPKRLKAHASIFYYGVLLSLSSLPGPNYLLNRKKLLTQMSKKVSLASSV